MNNASLTIARKLKDSSGQPVVGIGAPTNINSETLLGRPVFVDPNLANMANTAKSILFGDFCSTSSASSEGCGWRNRQTLPSRMPLISYRVIIRLVGALVDSGAVRR